MIPAAVATVGGFEERRCWSAAEPDGGGNIAVEDEAEDEYCFIQSSTCCSRSVVSPLRPLGGSSR